MAGFFDNGEGREKSLQIEPQMTFGGRLAAPMFCPAHAIGHQGDGARVDRMDGTGEAAGDAFVRQSEVGRQTLKVVESLPEKRLHHVGVPLREVGVLGVVAREEVARGEELELEFDF